jgi:hypothetical protein
VDSARIYEALGRDDWAAVARERLAELPPARG